MLKANEEGVGAVFKKEDEVFQDSFTSGLTRALHQSQSHSSGSESLKTDSFQLQRLFDSFLSSFLSAFLRCTLQSALMCVPVFNQQS